MNHVGAGTLNAVERAALVTALGSLIQDTDTSDSFTISVLSGSGTMDPATGLYTGAESVSTVTGWTAPLTLKEVSAAGGTYQLGDRRFVAMSSDVTGTLSTSIRIRHDSTNYAAVTVEQDPLDLTWHIIARRTA